MNPETPFQPTSQPPQNGLPPVSPSPTSQTPADPWTNQPTATVAPTPVAAEPQPQHTSTNAQSYDASYLDQIAPAKQANVNRFAVVALIAVVIISAIAGVFMILNSGGPSANSLIPPLSERIGSLQSVTDTSQKRLAENQITSANAALSSSLTSMKADLDAIIKNNKLKTDKNLAATEKAYLAKLQKTLDDAHQRGTLDRTYTTQMTYELTVLKSRLSQLKKASRSETTHKFCDDAIKNIDAVLKSYESFSATKG